VYSYTINQCEFTNQKKREKKTSKQRADSLSIPCLPHPPLWMYQRHSLDRQPYMQKCTKNGKQSPYRNIGTKCNGLTQQFIGISTTIHTWATCFDSYCVIFRPSKNTDPISKVVKCTVGSPMLTKIVTVTIWNHIQGVSRL